MKSFLDEFKAFAMRGNVVDLAVAVVIGGAFAKITTSLVEKVLMPLLGVLTGGVNLAQLSWTLRAAEGAQPALILGYGAFLQSVIDFVIIAFAIFIVIKQMNRFMKKEKEQPSAPPAPTKDQELLSEIRDLLKKER